MIVYHSVCRWCSRSIRSVVRTHWVPLYQHSPSTFCAAHSYAWAKANEEGFNPANWKTRWTQPWLEHEPHALGVTKGIPA